MGALLDGWGSRVIEREGGKTGWMGELGEGEWRGQSRMNEEVW